LKIVVATDLASRGIDVKDIDLIINYDMPQNIESYIHRIGRTARAGRKGTAWSFFCLETDSAITEDLVSVMKDAGQQPPPELLRALSGRRR